MLGNWFHTVEFNGFALLFANLIQTKTDNIWKNQSYKSLKNSLIDSECWTHVTWSYNMKFKKQHKTVDEKSGFGKWLRLST